MHERGRAEAAVWEGTGLREQVVSLTMRRPATTSHCEVAAGRCIVRREQEEWAEGEGTRSQPASPGSSTTTYHIQLAESQLSQALTRVGPTAQSSEPLAQPALSQLVSPAEPILVMSQLMAQLGSKWLSSAGSATLSRAVATLAEAPESRSHIELTLDRHSAQFVKEILCSHFKTSRTPKFTLYILQTSANSVLVLHDPLLPSLDKGSNTIEELALIVLNEEKAYFSSSEEPQSRASSRPSSKSAGNPGVGARLM